MNREHAIQVNGRDGYLAVPIIAIPGITVIAFTFFRDHLPDFCLQNAIIVIGIAGLFTAAMIVVSLFLRGRKVVVGTDQLNYQSWLTQRTLRLDRLTAVSFETEVSGDDEGMNIEHYLSLWSGEDLLLQFNTRLWPREGLGRMLKAIRERAPSLHLDRDVQAYLTRR